MKRFFALNVILLICVLLLSSCLSWLRQKPKEPEIPADYPYTYMKTVPIINKNGNSTWTIGHYIDKYGITTEIPYIYTKENQSGLCTNSAGRIKASINFTIDKNLIGMFIRTGDIFQETGGSSDYQYYVDISIKSGDKEISLDKTNWVGDRIFISNPKDVKNVFQSFVENQIVYISISVDHRFGNPDEYFFKIDTSGFEEMYANAFIPVSEQNIASTVEVPKNEHVGVKKAYGIILGDDPKNYIYKPDGKSNIFDWGTNCPENISLYPIEAPISGSKILDNYSLIVLNSKITGITAYSQKSDTNQMENIINELNRLYGDSVLTSSGGAFWINVDEEWPFIAAVSSDDYVTVVFESKELANITMK